MRFAVPIQIVDTVAKILQIFGQAVLAFMVLSITYDATMRYFFAAPTSWSLEVNAFFVAYLALMTAADVERRGEHIGITLLPEAAGPFVRSLLSAIIGIVGTVFCGILVWRGYLMAHDAFIYGERVSSAFGTPMWIPYSMLPVGFGVLGLQFFIGIFRGRTMGSTETSQV
ncbi:TRAP transporter small permease [Acuticoccus sp. M5D2P5]|uniref:TRAP transporter small permease n=1 Tax=Acuticoccus kalidii TaxID=2910977 RepID=UPI001F28D41F|nr:TRAP transporter small permease [Acuticoccus kalidii]MCF3932081.1 TRAP transporter small permease [Acuticoccus kalidii]